MGLATGCHHLVVAVLDEKLRIISNLAIVIQWELTLPVFAQNHLESVACKGEVLLGKERKMFEQEALS